MYYSKSTGHFYNATIHGNNIPADAVEITDDDYATLLAAQSAGQQIMANDNGYPIAIDPTPPIRTQSSLLAELATNRWQVETGGILVAGHPVATDRESQTQLTSAYASLQNGLIANTPWKAEDGSFTLVTLAELEPVAQAVAAHVRACFAAEEIHCQAIASLQTQAELDAYDIAIGWPTGQ